MFISAFQLVSIIFDMLFPQSIANSLVWHRNKHNKIERVQIFNANMYVFCFVGILFFFTYIDYRRVVKFRVHIIFPQIHFYQNQSIVNMSKSVYLSMGWERIITWCVSFRFVFFIFYFFLFIFRFNKENNQKTIFEYWPLKCVNVSKESKESTFWTFQ